MTTPELSEEHARNRRLAMIFDLRSFIGSMFVIFGVLLTITGLAASEEDIAKATGLRLSLWTGIVMLIVGVIFIVWTLLSPPEVVHPHEMSEDDLPEQLRHQGLEQIPEHSHEIHPRSRKRPPAH
jgi:hypothetical protein